MANYNIRQYTESDKIAWDRFVKSSDNGTIFNYRKFLSYHIERKVVDNSLLIFEDDNIKALFPAGIIDREDGKVLYSHPGASYGGIIVSRKSGLEDIDSFVNLINDYAKKNGFSSVVITQMPIYYYKNQTNNIDFSLYSKGYKLLNRELSSVLSLMHPLEDTMKLFLDPVKRAVKKADKAGIEIKISNDIDEYYEILKSNLELRHNVTPTHTLEELKKLIKLFPDQIRLYGAYYGSKLIGGMVNFDCNKDVSLAFYIAHDHSFQKIRPVDKLFQEVVKDIHLRGFKYLDFGTFTLKMEPNWGLCRFKEKFGARGIFRDTYEHRI